MPITVGGPIRLPCASGGARAFKFRDEDGHPLELLEFHPEDRPRAGAENDSGVSSASTTPRSRSRTLAAASTSSSPPSASPRLRWKT